MADGYSLGKDAKLWYLPGKISDGGSYTECTNIKDLNADFDHNEADVSTRGSGDWEETVPTRKKAEITFDMVWDEADDNFVAFRDAWLNKTTLGFDVLSGNPGQGLRADMKVFKFSKKETLDEAQMVSVSIKPTRSDTAPSWVEDISH